MRIIQSWLTKRTAYTLLLCVFMLTPGIGAFEDDLTITLAKTLCQMGQYETRETMIAIGSTVMNRVDDPRFPDTIREVLNQPGAFHRGGRYDERSLAAAKEVLAGKRTVPPEMVYLHKQETIGGERFPDGTLRSGGYLFSDHPIQVNQVQ